MNKSNTTTLYCLAIMLTAWCTWNSVKSGNLLSSVLDIKSNTALLSREVGSALDRITGLELEAKEVIEKEIKAVKELGEKVEELIPDLLK